MESTMSPAKRMNDDVHSTTYDNRLKSTLKSIGVTTVPAMEEVLIFKDDETVIQISNPKVEASIGANTWVVSGSSQTKNMRDILSGVLNQLGPDQLDNIRKLAEKFQKQALGAAEGAKATSAQQNMMMQTHNL